MVVVIERQVQRFTAYVLIVHRKKFNNVLVSRVEFVIFHFSRFVEIGYFV